MKNAIKQCIKCSRFEKIPYQLLADLPAERLTPAEPFQTCGLDLAGPVYNKPGVKTYIAIFVCFVTKAVNIGLVTDLTKESCIFAIQRFHLQTQSTQKISPTTERISLEVGMTSSKCEILALEKNRNSIGSFISQEMIEWEMIPPRPPHFGGLWKRQ